MGGPVNFVDAAGKRYAIPEDKVDAAIIGGLTPETESQRVERVGEDVLQQRYGGAGGTLGAVGAGAARAATLGLSDVAADALGVDEDLAQLRRVNPGASIAGEVVGGVGAAVGGLGLAGLAARGGAGAAAAVGAGRGVGGAILGTATGAALEGAAQGAGAYLSQVALEDKELSADAFVGSMGQGALFGGAIGGVLGAGAATLERARALFPRGQATPAAAAELEQKATAEVRSAVADGESLHEQARRQIEQLKVEAMQSRVAAQRELDAVKIATARATLEKQMAAAEKARIAAEKAKAGPAPRAARTTRKVFAGDPIAGGAPPAETFARPGRRAPIPSGEPIDPITGAAPGAAAAPPAAEAAAYSRPGRRSPIPQAGPDPIAGAAPEKFARPQRRAPVPSPGPKLDATIAAGDPIVAAGEAAAAREAAEYVGRPASRAPTPDVAAGADPIDALAGAAIERGRRRPVYGRGTVASLAEQAGLPELAPAYRAAGAAAADAIAAGGPAARAIGSADDAAGGRSIEADGDEALVTLRPEAAAIVDAARNERMSREAIQSWIAGARRGAEQNAAERGWRISHVDSLTGARRAPGVGRKLDRVTELVEETEAAAASRRAFERDFITKPTLAEQILDGRPPPKGFSIDDILETSRLQARDRGLLLDDAIEAALRKRMAGGGSGSAPAQVARAADDDLLAKLGATRQALDEGAELGALSARARRGAAAAEPAEESLVVRARQGADDAAAQAPAATRSAVGAADEAADVLLPAAAAREAAPPAAPASVSTGALDEGIAAALGRKLPERAAMEDVVVGARLISAHEAASADLAEALGSAAPAAAAARAQAYRAATAAAADAGAGQAAQAGQVAAKLAPEVARRTGGGAAAGGGDGMLGRLGDLGAGLEVMRAMGLPTPDFERIPVIGPVLSMYLRARAALAVARRGGGGVARTVETEIARRSAVVRDRTVVAVGAMLGGGARAARAARPAAGPLAALGYRLFPSGGGGARKTGEADPVTAWRARMDELARAAAPGAVREAVRDHVPTSDPALADAIAATTERKLAFLRSKAPSEPQLPALLRDRAGEWRPSRQQLERWARYVAAAEDPAGVLEDVAAGRGVSIEAAETLRTVYPALYAEAQRTLLERARELDVTVPYHRRVSLGILFRVPIDASLRPEHLRFLSAGGTPSGAAPAQPQQGRQPPAPTMSAPVAVGDRAMTSLDRRGA